MNLLYFYEEAHNEKIISFVLLTAFLCSMLIIGYAQDNIVYSKSMDEIVKEDAVRIKEYLNSELQKNDVYNVRPMWVINEWFERYEPATQVEKKDAYKYTLGALEA